MMSKYLNDYDKFLFERSLFQQDNKVKKWEKIIIDSVISFMKEKLEFDTKITVRKKNSNSLIGDIVLHDEPQSRYTLHFNPNQSLDMMITTLIHELTHIKQAVTGELIAYRDEKGMGIEWKGEKYITSRKYKAIKDIEVYKELPWEKEAYDNMIMIDDFKDSLYFKELANSKDDNVRFVIDNL